MSVSCEIDHNNIYVPDKTDIQRSNTTSYRHPLVPIQETDTTLVYVLHGAIVTEDSLNEHLEQAINIVTDTKPNTKLLPHEWRLKHFLHLHYRLGIQYKVLSNRLGYTESHLLCLHREQVLEMARIFVSQIMHKSKRSI